MLKTLLKFFNRSTIAAPVRNRNMMGFADKQAFLDQRLKAEETRAKENRPHDVLYFHKVDDPYSYLTASYAGEISKRFNVEVTPILVGDDVSETVHEPSMYDVHCLNDAKRIGPYYDVHYHKDTYPDNKLVQQANSVLIKSDKKEFIHNALEIAKVIWGDKNEMSNELSNNELSDTEIQKALKEGNTVRDKVGYYFGSAFHYEGENYWGLDRLNHLEDRLIDLKLNKENFNDYIISPALTAPAEITSEKKLNLHFFPSLNSPYTYVSINRTRDFAAKYNLNLITRPVLPMLMREMYIPLYKAKYIISDAAREGRRYEQEIDKIYSPLGQPARRAYSLFPVIDSLGKGFEYIALLMDASFNQGINIGEIDKLKAIAEKLNISWDELEPHLDTEEWKKVLSDNLKDMYSGNCWGVPSYKITNEDGSNPFYVWGQDRIWLLKEEAYMRLS